MNIKNRFEKGVLFLKSNKNDNLNWLNHKIYFFLYLGLIIFAATTQYQIRADQWIQWNENPEVYFSNDTPMVNAKDAPFFLGLADDYRKSVNSFRFGRNFPDGSPEFWAQHKEYYDQQLDYPTKHSWYDIPMLSFLLAYASEYMTNGNTTLAGNLMIPFTAFLSAFAIGCMFWMAKHPVEGAVAAVGFGISPIVFVRTSMGRIDTDQLIWFFLSIILGLILLTIRHKSFRSIIITSILIGFITKLFLWWYYQGLFVVLIPLLLGLTIYINHKKITWAISSTLVLIILLGPISFFDSLFPVLLRSLYVLGINPEYYNLSSANSLNINLQYPDIFLTIEELKPLPLKDNLIQVGLWLYIAIIGLIGFLIWSTLYFKKSIVFLPFFILGVSSFVSGYRFGFYLSPFLWFGFAWLIFLLLQLVLNYFSGWISHVQQHYVIIFISVITMTSVAIHGYNINSNFRPIFSPKLISMLDSLKSYHKNNLPQNITNRTNPIIYTWWDYGFISNYETGFSTFIDGGAQNSPKTFLIARGFVDNNQKQLVQIANLIASGGLPAIYSASSNISDLQKEIANASPSPQPIYILLTQEMIMMMPRMAEIGLYNIVEGKSISKQIFQAYIPTYPTCNQISETEINCNSSRIDIEKGIIDGKPLLSEIIQIRNGFVINRKKINSSAPMVMVLNDTDQGVRVRFMQRILWDSMYYQLMERAEFDKNKFKLVVDHYPFGRVYEIIK